MKRSLVDNQGCPEQRGKDEVQSSEDAADPERPAHKHLEYPRPDDSSPGGE